MSDFKQSIDKKTAEVLYRTYWNDAVKTAQKILMDRAAAEDCASSAMITLFDNLDKTDPFPSSRTRGYLIVITRNLAFREYNLQKKIFYNSETAEEQLEQTPDEKETEDIVFNNWTSREIADGLSRLSKRDADILILTYGFDHTVSECAKLLGISTEAAKKALQRSRKKLRKELEKNGYK